jgi:hypothetical protein
MTTEETLQPDESFGVISRMILSAKNRLADDGFFFILWGWLVFAAASLQYVLIQSGTGNGNWVWAVLMPAGGIASMIYGFRKNKQERVKTYIDTYLTYLWGGFLLALLLVLGTMSVHGMHSTFFMLLVLYGLATFISGGLLNFRPLIIGSVFSFAAAVCSVFVSDINHLLCIAGAILFSYIIPGHMLRSEHKSRADV